MADDRDRIERTIEINATVDKVWDLVSEPGWWINEGTIRPHQIEHEGDISTVHDSKHGTFRIRTVRLDPPRYAAFRWLTQEGGAVAEESTLVEFWVDAELDGGPVTVRVVESGFDALNISAEQRRRQVADNTEGWEIELGAARAFLAQ